MWFNQEQVQQLGMQEVHRPRYDYDSWANTQLPESEEYHKHPYCNTLETALINVLSRSLSGISVVTGSRTSRYKWTENHIEIMGDPIKNLLYLEDPGGHAFIGVYRHVPYAYSFPALGYTRRADECIPIFLRDIDLVEATPYNEEDVVFFRNRQLENLPDKVLRRIERQLGE